MTISELRDLVEDWDRNSDSEAPTEASKFDGIMKQLEFFSRTEWSRYLPATSPEHLHDYMARLAAWIGNLSDDSDRKLLLEYALKIAFFSQDDFWALYRSAFKGPVTRWVIDQAGIRLNNPKFAELLHLELHRQTWFCPITDSMNINEFYHANHIVGIQHRPCFSTLAMLDGMQSDDTGTNSEAVLTKGLAANLKKYLQVPEPGQNTPPLKRVVLLEDFVGSGTQMKQAVKWAVTELKLQTLVVPLIICPKGQELADQLVAENAGQLAIHPIIKVERSDLVGPERGTHKGWSIAQQMEELATRTFPAVTGQPLASGMEPPYNCFGFKQTGCSVATFSNTPDNSIPLIHHRPKQGTWVPLFPRSARL